MEIGGYLEYERYYGEEYHKNCLKLNTARNCLKYIIEAKGIKQLWISRWNCSAVLDTCRSNNVELHYYDLDENLQPIIPVSYAPGDYIYIVNYFGQIKYHQTKNAILDNVQAFFQMPPQDTDTIYTCRKFFGVSDGAYLYTNSVLNRELERDKSTERIRYLSGRLERTGSEYYNEYQENERILDLQPVRKMSEFTENIMRSIDYSDIKKRRERNYLYLHERLKHYNRLKVIYPEGPFAYPFKYISGDSIRKQLISKKIYIAKLWPNVTDCQEKELADNILPLPCDQRYSVEDMKFVADELLKCIE